MTQDIGRRAFVAGITAACLATNVAAQAQTSRTTLRWSVSDQLAFAAFFPEFAGSYATPVDCADLALDALLTFARDKHLPVRLFDFDGPGNSKRWLRYDPRSGNWATTRAYILEQMGAINVIENSQKISLPDVRAGDLIMHEHIGGVGYTGHTRVLLSAEYDAERRDYLIRRYEGTLPPVVPVLKESWFKDIVNVYGGTPRRWNFGQFSMG